ncbi:glycoside hydrolase family 172 protein [Confluentibacter flavum]|nr:glycoside hydrolase family 172 protein [Confluentibacter flavum]
MLNNLRMNQILKLTSMIFLFFTMNLVAQDTSNSLSALTQDKEGVKSKRVSSYDETGKNSDYKGPIKPGEFFTLCDIKGTGIINHIWITISPTADEMSRNDVVLRMYWDGSETPSVESPIGAFFGQGWEESYDFSSLPLSAGPKNGAALVSYFQMPFHKSARIEIENQSDTEIDAFYYYVDYIEVDKLPNNTLYFHAWYNHELTKSLPDGENEWGLLGESRANSSVQDNYLIMETKGKGHFVGVNYYVNSPTPMWYGEGDDMMYIDGESSPSLHGTGTEDYFNTSWCPKVPFSHPYFGYPRVNGDIGWLGRTHVYRYHITDPIHFDSSFKFTIEHGHNNNLTLDLASVAYWYQDKPFTEFPKLQDKEERKPMPIPSAQDIHIWRDAWRKSKGYERQLWGNERE